MAFFIAFPKTSGLFDNLVAACPLRYSSPNAPSKRDVLGTALLSVLSGHRTVATPELPQSRAISASRTAASAGDHAGGCRDRMRDPGDTGLP